MSDKYDLTGTYWFQQGKQQAAADKLATLIPDAGEVERTEENPALETYRKAANCYYDLYNNGLCNRAAEFAEVFGFSLTGDDDDDFGDSGDSLAELDQATVRKIERRLTTIINAAAREQGITS